MDVLTHLFCYFNFRTDLFFIGSLCQLAHFDEENKGYLHFIRSGNCVLNIHNQLPQTITKPCIIFSPSNVLHNIHPLSDEPLEIFCINFDFGEGIHNPLAKTLHNITLLFLDERPELSQITEQIFLECEKKACGFQAAIHHLCAYLMIQVIRCCLAQKQLKSGLLLGLIDKKLSPVLYQLHQSPEKEWQLDEMAGIALMSRARFSAHFKQIMGMSPMEYLAHWRVAMAQQLLKTGLPVSLVAEKVGYSHNAGLSRAFMRITKQSPTEWLDSLR